MTITRVGADTAARQADERMRALFIDYIRAINNMQVDSVKNLHIVMPMYHRD